MHFEKQSVRAPSSEHLSKVIDMYDLYEYQAPKVTGPALEILSSSARFYPLSYLLSQITFQTIGLQEFRQQTLRDDTDYFSLVKKEAFEKSQDHPILDDTQALSYIPQMSFPFTTSFDYQKFYREGGRWEQVIERIDDTLLNWKDKTGEAHNFFITYTNQRLCKNAKGENEQTHPLIPTAVKDEVDIEGLPTTAGKKHPVYQAPRTAFAVKQMLKQGALILGKLNMHEIGMGVTGVNAHHGTPSHPYVMNGFPGGSSSASAATVGFNLFPYTLGADGGGSIRIPAALCGVYGLKPTFRSVSESGAYPLCPTVAHLGPIANNPFDLYKAYLAMAQENSQDPFQIQNPRVKEQNLLDINPKKVRLGFDPLVMEHCQPEIASACKQYLDGLKYMGFDIVELSLGTMKHYRNAHLITILSEMHANEQAYFKHKSQEYGCDTRLNLSMVRHLKGEDYVKAQMLRTDMARKWLHHFEKADVILTPSTSITSQTLSSQQKKYNFSDIGGIEKIIRFAWQANLIGLPALSQPIGYSSKKAPIGLQLIGKAYSEQLLCSIALKTMPLTPWQKPRLHFNPFG